MKLSLCIATFNEEKNIHYPLDSAYDLVDEVVIVDGGSADKTIEVVKSYGKKVRVITSDNPVMFHKNKQKAIEAAKGEWILQLDADEELTDELKGEIRSIVISNNDKVVAYWLPRKNWFLSRFLMKGGQYPDYTVRLYRNGYARFPCKDVHENVEIISNLKTQISKLQLKSQKFENLKLEIGYIKNPISHYADPDFSRYLLRWDRYTTAEVERMPKDTHLSFFKYFGWYPKKTFFLMYFRHKGFMDGFPGFVFALFSSIRFWVIYVKWRAKKGLSSLSSL